VKAFQPEVVLHMGARTDLRGTSIADYTTNTEGVSNLIVALQQIPKVRLAVFASSMLVCRIGYSPKTDEDYAPSTAYGESKVEGELRVRHEAADRLPWVIIRPTSIWGPWFSTPYRDFFDAVRKGRYFHPSGRNIYRNYGFVLNAVQQIDALVATAAAGVENSTLYLADYEAVDLKEWALAIQDEFKAPTVRDVPLFALRLAAKLGDRLQKIGVASPLTSFRLNNLLTNSILDTRPLQNVLGVLPYDLKSAVALTCEWMKSSEGRP
jgi:nucleoside-diphosphate-sugar epimerase